MKLSIALLLSVTLFSSCKNTLSGKWYMKTAENLETKQKMDFTDCTYFEFKDNDTLTSGNLLEKSDETWQQSGDTLILKHNSEGGPAYFKIELFTRDTLVISDKEAGIRLSFNTKCTPES